MQEKKSPNRLFSAVVCRASAVMLLVTLISCHVISGTVAKYTTGSSAGSDTARAATFSVEAVGDNNNVSSMSLEYGNSNASKNYKLTVTNNSEVAVKYTVSITFASNVTGKLKATLKGTEKTTPSGGTTFTWTDAGFLGVGDTEELTLTLTVDSGVADLGETESSAHESFTFSTSVEFEQID